MIHLIRKKIITSACILWLGIAVSSANAENSKTAESGAKTHSAVNYAANTLTSSSTHSNELVKSTAPKSILHITTPPLEKSAHVHEAFFLQVLQLALEKNVATDGPFVIEQHREHFSHKRFLSELSRENGAIDIIWTMNDKRREQELLPIKISLLRGLNSYRIFLIRKEDQEKFNSITTLQDLSKLAAGSGAIWPDTPILESNGLPVITAAHYELLFTMLAAKRFDYFPRGLYEIWNEQQANIDKQFSIEQTLMLHYPAPIYFFVNKKNAALANRIERGLLLAMNDGSFDRLFFSIPGFKKGFDEMHNSSRRILTLTTNYNDGD